MSRANHIYGKTVVWTLLIAGFVGMAWVSAAQAVDDKKPSFTQLQQQLRKAYQSEDYKKALEVAGKMYEMRPDDVNTLYNTACLHCLLGDNDKAYQWIEKAIDAGYSDADFLLNDSDFKTIRGEDRFRKLVKRVRAKSQRVGSEGKDKETQKSDTSKKTEKPKEPKLSPRELGTRIGQLTQKLVSASDKGDRDAALKIALKALSYAQSLRKQIGDQADSALSLTQYNVACMYSLKGEKDEAFEHLEKVVKLGWFNGSLVDQIKGDSDFDNIRKDSRFSTILKRAEKKSSKIITRARPGEKTVRPKWKVTLPEGFDKSTKAPLIVALHHYNGNMEKTTRRWKKAAGEVGAILLTPQGTVQSSSDSYHWGRNINVIEENIMDAMNEVMDQYKVDEDKIVLAGFSQGGWATWELAMRNPDTFCGIIPVAGRFKAASESVMADKDLAGLRVFIMVGGEDNSRVIDSNRQAARRFKKIGAKVKLNIYDGVGHGFPDNATAEQVKALRFVLNR